MAGFLTCSLCKPSHYSNGNSGNEDYKDSYELTVAGTVPDFHWILFYFSSRIARKAPSWWQI